MLSIALHCIALYATNLNISMPEMCMYNVYICISTFNLESCYNGEIETENMEYSNLHHSHFIFRYQNYFCSLGCANVWIVDDT